MGQQEKGQVKANICRDKHKCFTSQGEPSQMLQEEMTYSRCLHLHENVTLSWLIVENTIISHTQLYTERFGLHKVPLSDSLRLSAGGRSTIFTERFKSRFWKQQCA